ncbi:MAG: DUF2892 domain-containing protein [Candidatus Ruthia sp.]|nr:DUF2892 domain-containing protein [Candidatus Ruthturnera sp.]
MDTRIRFSVGSIIIIVGLWFGSIWGMLGFISVLSAILGHCPVYTLFDTSSCSEDCGRCGK